jgi:CYTH domain-containing protein
MSRSIASSLLDSKSDAAKQYEVHAMTHIPKYAAVEIERRWLVDLAAVGDVASTPFREIEDLYVVDTRMRLRRVTDQSGATVFKFGKKYGKFAAEAEAVTNLYLTDAEYRRLSALPGNRTVKRRYSVAGGALDVYQSPRAGFAVFEIEFADVESAQAYEPPAFVSREITTESSFSGVSVAELERTVSS